MSDQNQLERKAMEAIAAALASLQDDDSRRRVLQWVDDCLHTFEPPAADDPLSDLAALWMPDAAETADLSVDGVDELFTEATATPLDASARSVIDDEPEAAVAPLVQVAAAPAGPLDTLVRDLASDLQRFAEALQQPA